MKLKHKPWKYNHGTTWSKSILRTILPSMFLIASGQCFYASATTSGSSISATQSQKVSVNGTVTGKNGEPLIGVSVVEDGTSNGVVTDINGYFALKVKPGATLRLSYIGYETQEIKTNGQNHTFSRCIGFLVIESKYFGLLPASGLVVKCTHVKMIP